MFSYLYGNSDRIDKIAIIKLSQLFLHCTVFLHLVHCTKL